MICLGIQTAVQPYSIALVTEKGLLAEHTLQQNYDASEDLMAWIESLCGSVDTKVSELSAIAVVNGPGSYTGLRIGVTTAKTIGLVFGMPVYGVSSLEALAQAGRVSDTVVVSIMPARKNEFNFQLFSSF
jgi:tRNA threonylcarbamoyladenosine biosynthesis protein TsaB